MSFVDEAVTAEGTAEGTPAEGVELDNSTIESEGLTEGEHSEAGEGSVEEPLYEVKVNGRTEKVTLDQALKGHMREADYTRKTQELAREREGLAEMRALQVALERNPQATLAALASALQVPLFSGQPAAAASDAETDPFELLAREVQGLKGVFTQQQAAQTAAQQQATQAQQIQNQIERELGDLASIYGDFDRKQVLQYAVDHKTDSLEIAYKAWQHDVNEQRRIDETNKATNAKRRAQVVEGGRSTAPGSTVRGTAGAKPSVREAYRMAVDAQK